jgi:hypothetical protein
LRWCGLVFNCLRISYSDGFFEHGSELSVCVKARNFLTSLSIFLLDAFSCFSYEAVNEGSVKRTIGHALRTKRSDNLI